jgi:hypothetical protein
MPVCIAARAGAQTGLVVQAVSNMVPLRAIRSRLGVRPSGQPAAPTVSQRCWSVKKTITLGRIKEAP